MVIGWSNVELALKLENDEGSDGVTETILVDNRLEETNVNSNTNEVADPEPSQSGTGSIFVR